MATQTLSTADAILKDAYVGPIVEQLNYKTYLMDMIERDGTKVDHTGRRAIVPIHTGRNRGRGARGDAGTLPTAGAQLWQDAIVPIKYNYIGIELSDGAIEASQSNEGAFVSLLTAETKGAVADEKKDINRQLWGTGDGKLANVTATATSATQTLDSVQYIAVGDPVDVLVAATGATSTGVVGAVVIARDVVAKTMTLNSSITAGSTFAVYITGDRSNELNGIREFSSTNRTLFGIDSSVAANSFWNAQVLDVGASAAAPAVAGEASFEQLIDNVGLTGQGDVSTILTTRGIKRRLADTYQSQKRFNDAAAVNIHGGYSAIMVNEVPVIADDDAPLGFAFAFDKDALRWFTQGTPGWLERDGGVFHLKDGAVAGSKVAVWQAWYKMYCNFATVAPNRMGLLRYCTDSNAV